ncbi:DUF6456 domain-containing protein [Rhodopseudomonas sp. BR0M22]|uniref:DUF6456 domain-containing protein n=1 Tax=Rhodopseudomonas sp. BR0M22 TaxID=2269369 RepID=UPI0013E03270|nr:DUF6456 domain-containing protein [Rhodopseudomonas sp. BR0M22]NEW91295.1 DNA replication protein [Rhodopseudomonas sp. BR0M22]
MHTKRRGRKSAAARGPGRAEVDSFRASHLDLAERDIMTAEGLARVTIDDSESPLAWLARRKGRDGQAMISAEQFVAGERLRADFTRGNLTPRVTSNWGAPTGRAGSGGAGEMTDLVVAARQRVQHALDACGPEFCGILLDVCCFLRGLEDVERERGWPSRSAKVVLQLALDRLARHYGLAPRTEQARPRPRSWLADDAAFVVP